MTKDVKFGSSINITTHTSSANLETDIVTTAKPPGGKPQILVYDADTPSRVLASDSTSYVGIDLEPDSLEIITETIDRGRSLFERGGKLGFKLPEIIGGGEFSFELAPKKETRTFKKAVFRSKTLTKK
jgi:hypothetical protein